MNNELKDAYVSFETAKLLKEKGFGCNCQFIYSEDGNLGLLYIGDCINLSEEMADENYTAPTQSLAMRWLRESYNIFISIGTIPHSTITMEQKYYYHNIFKDRRGVSIYEKKIFYATYEEACEAAILYCLTHLI